MIVKYNYFLNYIKLHITRFICYYYLRIIMSKYLQFHIELCKNIEYNAQKKI